jgi:hypothetical protein
LLADGTQALKAVTPTRETRERHEENNRPDRCRRTPDRMWGIGNHVLVNIFAFPVGLDQRCRSERRADRVGQWGVYCDGDREEEC